MGVVDLRERASRLRSSRSSQNVPRGQRPLPLRERRRRARTGAVVVTIIALAAAVYGVHWVSYLPQYAIHSIDVTGAEKISPEVIANYARSILFDGSRHFLSRQNMFLYPRAAIERDVQANFPIIRSAHVSRPSFMATAITIAIQERVAYARWCHREGSECFYIDNGGYVYAMRDDGDGVVPKTLYVFSGGLTETEDLSPIGQRFALAHLTGLVSFLDHLGQAGYHPATIFVMNDSDFSVTFDDGLLLKASFGEDTNTVIQNLGLILSSDPLRNKKNEIEYIDLRFGNKAYYKLKGDSGPTQSQ